MSDTFTKKKTAGIYIHIPFCLRKCGYCDFYSQLPQSSTQLQHYVTVLRWEIEKTAPLLAESSIQSIYFGGGTPSLLAPEQVQGIIKMLRANFNISSSAEISLEMNPSTTRKGFIREIIAAGVNRISLGVQSFSGEELKVLSRIHGYYEIMHSIETLHREGCHNINLDLIYGIPGQSPDSWRRSLEMAVACKPQHISAYLLQLSANTAMGQAVQNGQIELPDEESESSMYYMALDYLPGKGFKHYELSNFCKDAYECSHNLNYWQGGDYLGIGAGAVTCLKRQRYQNRPLLDKYLKNMELGQEMPVEMLEQMNLEEKMREEIILALRLCDGIDLLQFAAKHQVDLKERFAVEIAEAERKGLLKTENNRLSLTRRGYFLSNQVFCYFI